MKGIYLQIVGCIVLLLIQHKVFSQWTYSGIVEGGNISNITASNTSLFAMSNDGLYVSRNTGESWEKIEIEQIISSLVDPVKEIQNLQAFGNNIFLCTKKGVFISNDDGYTWSDMNEGIPKGRVLERIRIFNETVIGCSSSDLFLFKKDSSKWTNIKGNIYKNIFIKDIYPIGNTIYMAAYGKGVIRTSDLGKTWETISDSLPTDKVLCITQSGNNLIAGMNREGLAYKNIYESYWRVCKNIPKRLTVYTFYVVGNTVFAATNMGIYISTDNGENWFESNTGIGEHIQIKDITVLNGVIFAASDGSGVFKSDNFGNSWTLANTGIKLPIPINTIYETEGKMYCGTGGSGVFVSEDGGGKWLAMNNGLPGKTSVNGFAEVDTFLLVGTNKGVFKLNRKTNTWINTGGVTIAAKSVNQIISRGKVFYLATNSGLFRSYNFGKIWKSIHEKGITNPNILCFDIYIDKQDTFLYAGTEEGLFISLDNAKSWQKVEDNKISKVFTVKVLNDKVYICTEKYYSVLVGDIKLKKIKTVTTGRDKKGIPGKMVVRDFKNIKNKYVIAAGDRGVFYTKNSGKEWIDLSLGLANLNITSIHNNERLIYIGNNVGEIYIYPTFKK